MENVVYRPIGPDEFRRFAWTTETAFGEDLDEENLAAHRASLELDRTVAAFDGERMVGTLAVLSLELTLPGEVLLPAGGVTWVGVLPTHRRKGVLTRMMWRALRDSEARREPVSALQASEALIYGRFGYGPATFHASYEVDRLRAAFREVPRAPGSLRQVEKQEAGRILPGIFDSVRRRQVGAVSRSPGWWTSHFADSPLDREDGGTLAFILHEDLQGRPDGYATYRVKQGWQQWLPDNTLIVVEVVASSSEVRAVLLHALLSMDLMRVIRLEPLAVDDELRWLLSDPRQLRTRFTADDLWVRLLDIERALSSRSYRAAGKLVLEVEDPLFPGKSGRYRLETEGERTIVQRTTDEAEIALDVATLGAAYLGGVSFQRLALARRLEERVTGACRKADLLFREDPAPFCGTMF